MSQICCITYKLTYILTFHPQKSVQFYQKYVLQHKNTVVGVVIDFCAVMVAIDYVDDKKRRFANNGKNHYICNLINTIRNGKNQIPYWNPDFQ